MTYEPDKQHPRLSVSIPESGTLSVGLFFITRLNVHDLTRLCPEPRDGLM